MDFLTYIIHVSTATERRKHIDNVISKNQCLNNNFFILEGDIKDLTTEVIKQYFPNSQLIPAQMSCAYKHILAYKEITKNEISVSLILEDDILLRKNFCSKLEKILEEIKERQLSNFIISIEDSNLKYVKQSELKTNILIYKKNECRFTGAYLIDIIAAKKLLERAEIEKLNNQPIDWFQNSCANNGIINIYWSHPALARQASTDGSMKTLIGEKRYGVKRIFSRNLQRFFKKIFSRFK